MEIKKIPEDGAKFVDYEITNNTISFKDEELAMNLSKREKDDAVHIDICSDQMGALVCGVAAGLRYVAQIDIPAREYIETTEGEGEEAVTTREPVPFSMDKCTLTLWEVEE